MREIGCGRTPERSSVARLTRREAEILRLVAEGNSNSDVARLLWITDHTVKFHLANIYRKLGIRNRIEASQWASKNRLFRPDEEQPGGETDASAREPRHPMRPPSGSPAVSDSLESGEQLDGLNIPSGDEEAAA
jgi:DNA-binding CsgD family transcriptional regulator